LTTTGKLITKERKIIIFSAAQGGKHFYHSFDLIVPKRDINEFL
jgi:hypothetical protein